MTAAGVSPALPFNPFPGLRPFRENEEQLFFGREAQTDRMVDRMAAARFLAVVGGSGSGKSSLINCGFKPALYRGLMGSAGASWRMAQFRPGANPILMLATALARDGVLFSGYQSDTLPLDRLIEATLRVSTRGLVDICKQARLAPGTNVLIVADQFEELFRYRSVAGSKTSDPFDPGVEAAALIRLLLEARAQTEVPIYVAITMRSDFLGDCAQFADLPEAINEGLYLVPRLTRVERRAAIAGPIAVAGGFIDPVLLTRLVNDVGDNPDQLSILQHALNRTWAYWQHQREGSGPLSLEDYETIGTLVHALERHAEKAYESIPEGRPREICASIFRTLTDKGTDPRGIRRPTRLSTLCAIAGAEPAEVCQVIEVFRKPSRSFLMPPLPEPLTPETVIDISHESLMRVWTRLKDWAEEEAETARRLRLLAERASEYPARAGLLPDPDLQVALDWREAQKPNAAWASLYRSDFEAAMSFLDKSRDKRDHDRVEVELEHIWWTRGGLPLLGTIVVTFIFNLDRHSHSIQALMFSALPATGGSAVIAGLESLVVKSLLALPYVIVYLGLSYLGRRLFRQLAYKRVLARVRGASEDAARASVPAIDPASFSYASAGRRFAAFLIDAIAGLLIFAAIFIFMVIVMVISDAVGGKVTGDQSAEVMFAIWPFGHWLYQAVTISSSRRATFGMRLAGIFVTDVRGRTLSFGAATRRHFAKILTYILPGFVIQPFTSKRQAPHDLISGSVVLSRHGEAMHPVRTSTKAGAIEQAATIGEAVGQ